MLPKVFMFFLKNNVLEIICFFLNKYNIIYVPDIAKVLLIHVFRRNQK